MVPSFPTPSRDAHRPCTHSLCPVEHAKFPPLTSPVQPFTSNPLLPGTRVNDVPPSTAPQILIGRAFPAPLHFPLPRFPPLQIFGRIFPDQLKLKQLARQPLYTQSRTKAALTLPQHIFFVCCQPLCAFVCGTRTRAMRTKVRLDTS
jgi:hypothetical protein